MAKRGELGRRDPEARRQAILEAALDVFAAEGFAAAKLDDVAEKAGVAKGTIYLHFKDKQDLFEQMVREAVFPVIARLEELAKLPDLPAELVLRAMFEVFRTQVLATRRKDLLRLILTEGPRFPAIAAFYHREVVARGLALMGELLNRARANGELSAEGLARFPQLVVAPLILAVVWDGLFAAIEPLDVEGLLAVHRELLLRGAGGRGEGQTGQGQSGKREGDPT
ncbi:MAG TPA: TetR/AcrR family transcriptional regulator [Hyphomicrobiaceae bacterium]|jgi:AcrR family transcriptional regulator|nr:TetR/AcrR family transcriptional regulator [Hyphomicrobiaceae bacterium]